MQMTMSAGRRRGGQLDMDSMDDPSATAALSPFDLASQYSFLTSLAQQHLPLRAGFPAGHR